MNSNLRKKPSRGRITHYDTKNNYRSQDNYSSERRKFLSDTTLYNIARFFMGNEVQVLTKNDKIEGVLRVFDSFSVWLSKVIVYDIAVNESFSLVKDLMEGKEIFWHDIVMIKVLYSNGKTDSVLVDQEISQKKQIIRSIQTEDKSLVPYFDDDEAQLDQDKDEVDLDISMKGDQCCWYHPEDMMKVNEERFNLKSTFNINMEEYTTQIDRTDPLLHEKYERAEKLAREMENDSSLRRVRQFEDDDEEQDEEKRFSAVISSETSSAMKQDSAAIVPMATPIKLNPNAPEFHPRPKQDNNEHIEEMQISSMSLMSDSMQQHQQQQQQMMQRFAQQISTQHQQQQQQQQQQQNQTYPGARLVSTGPQWTMPMHTTSPGQFIMQPYLQQGQLMPPMFQARHMSPQEAGQSAGLFYSLGPLQGQTFFVQPDHLSSSSSSGLIADPGSHMYSSTPDGQITAHHASLPTQQMRQPHLVPQNIPVLQGAASGHMSMHQQQQQQSVMQPQPQQPVALSGQQQQHHMNNYYQQQPHAMMAQAINPGHSAFSQLIFNPPTQLQGAPTIQSYLSNGRP